MSRANSEAGKKGAQRSPWSKGPHATTKAAELSYLRYIKRGKRNQLRKLGAGKEPMRLIMHAMPRALLEVGKVGAYGAAKYSQNGWLSVPDAVPRSCPRCDDDGRCVNGETHMWTERGEIVGECHCTCHMCQDVELPDIERTNRRRGNGKRMGKNKIAEP